jgi:hypothetical protein
MARTIVAAALLLAMTGLTGCSQKDSTEPATGGDCTARIVFDGRDYTEVGFVTSSGKELGDATRKSCDDSGEGSGTSDAGHVKTFAVAGYSNTDVVATEDTDASLRVFASDELSSDEVEAIRADLEGR